MRKKVATPHVDISKSRSNDAEKCVLGSMILDTKAAKLGVALLTAECFYSYPHQLLFSAIERCLGKLKNGMLEIPILIHELKTTVSPAGNSNLVEAGGVDYLLSVAEFVPSSANIEIYCKIVADHASQRVLAEAKTVAEAQLDESIVNPGELVKTYRKIIEKAEGIQSRVDRKLCSFVDVMREHDDRLLELMEGTATQKMMTTGMASLDAACGGFYPGDQIILGAFFGLGKTSLATQWIHDSARLTGKPWLVVSLEMSKEDLMFRFINSKTGISVQKQRMNALTSSEYSAVADAKEDYRKAPVYFEDRMTAGLQEIEALIQAIIRKHGEIGGFMIDYVQLAARSLKGHRGNTVEAIAEMVYTCKRFARTYNCTSILLSQLSNASQDSKDPSKRPTMVDLKGAGDIGASCDHGWLLWADKSRKPVNGYVACELILAKARNGATATIDLDFLAHRTLFVDKHGQNQSALDLAG